MKTSPSPLLEFEPPTSAVVDPGFPVGGGGADLLGGTNLRCVHFSTKTYAKTKEIDPVGGSAPAAPPGSANVLDQKPMC